MDSEAAMAEPVDIRVGVLLPPSGSLSDDGPGHVDNGYEPALGSRKRDGEARENRVAQIGQNVLRAAAEAIGREIDLVVGGVISGIEQRADSAQSGSFAIDDVVLKFGIKATIGAGKAIEAFFTASGEATVEVSLTLRPR